MDHAADKDGSVILHISITITLYSATAISAALVAESVIAVFTATAVNTEEAAGKAADIAT
jgi:hypothetical protein